MPTKTKKESLTAKAKRLKVDFEELYPGMSLSDVQKSEILEQLEDHQAEQTKDEVPDDERAEIDTRSLIGDLYGVMRKCGGGG